MTTAHLSEFHMKAAVFEKSTRSNVCATATLRTRRCRHYTHCIQHRRKRVACLKIHDLKIYYKHFPLKRTASWAYSSGANMRFVFFWRVHEHSRA